MYINLKKTLTAIEKCLTAEGDTSLEQLRRMYALTQRLMSQVLSVIYDREAFDSPEKRGRHQFAEERSAAKHENGVVSLTIHEPLPAMKILSQAVEEHWKAMIHAAISEAAQQGPLPHFEKAMVEIEIVTSRGNDNTRVWDTSNRAIQVILNNLKGIFFHDDDMEHMAFSVVGSWGEKGATIIRISPYAK